jgi:hypothetical protein
MCLGGRGVRKLECTSLVSISEVSMENGIRRTTISACVASTKSFNSAAIAAAIWLRSS